ncbi:MAG: cupin domain-containing protein [Acidimicrobiales bacterium]|nr:cupin domain-containing protein [Acidimicrobiales bacterium]
MAGAEARNFDSPDETRRPDKTTVETVKVGNARIGRATMQPGWRWSECIKPIVGTDACQVHHLGIVLSGQMRIAHGDGTDVDLAPGDVYEIQPGHDAWVLGDEPFVGVEFDATAVETYAKG